ncbi:MAG: FHA domain-containing protein [Bacteroides sp.]|nr:FHA domain-containing protein [Bacteroides sp.]
MNEIIKIKCPFDGRTLSVRYQPGIEEKRVTCPICKNTFPFTQFKRVDDTCANVGVEPSRPMGGDEETHTEFPTMNFTLGRLVIPSSGKTFQLKPGRNVIGRMATQSSADFQIDTGTSRTMSREHIVVEIRNVPGKGFVHYLTLFKEKVNPTMIGNQQIVYGDCIILNNGDKITLPGAILEFEIPDDNDTMI